MAIITARSTPLISPISIGDIRAASPRIPRILKKWSKFFKIIELLFYKVMGKLHYLFWIPEPLITTTISLKMH